MTTPTRLREAALAAAVAGAAVLAGAALTGEASVIPVLSLVAAVALVLGAKALGSSVLSRPAGARPGERGDPADDLVDPTGDTGAPSDATAPPTDPGRGGGRSDA